MKTLGNIETLLRNDKQQVVANGYPYLRIDGVLGCAIEGLDVKMLLDPFEEEFNLPPLTVEFSDSKRIFDGKVVGQEAIKLPSFKVLIYNESERIGILSGRVISNKSDGFIGKNTRSFVNIPRLKNFVDHVVFGSSNEVGAFLVKILVEFLERNIALIYQVESTGFNRDLIHHSGIVDFTWSEQNECRDRALEVHKRVHLESAFPMMELRPGTQFQTELYRAAVEHIYHLFKTNPQLFILVKCRGFLHQSHCKVLIDTPILLLIDFRKSGSRHYLDARPVEVSAEVKCSLNVSQTDPVGELSKAHHHELVTAVELDGVTVAFVAVDTLLELVFVNERHDLSEDCFSLVHGLRMAA